MNRHCICALFAMLTGSLLPQTTSAVTRADAIGQTLRIGVNASSVALAVGLILNLFTGYQGTASWLMAAGLLMLMATPIARVTATVVEYARERDWTFFILTSIVLAELLAGIGAALILHRRF